MAGVGHDVDWKEMDNGEPWSLASRRLAGDRQDATVRNHSSRENGWNERMMRSDARRTGRQLFMKASMFRITLATTVMAACTAKRSPAATSTASTASTSAGVPVNSAALLRCDR